MGVFSASVWEVSVWEVRCRSGTFPDARYAYCPDKCSLSGRTLKPLTIQKGKSFPFFIILLKRINVILSRITKSVNVDKNINITYNTYRMYYTSYTVIMLYAYYTESEAYNDNNDKRGQSCTRKVYEGMET